MGMNLARSLVEGELEEWICNRLGSLRCGLLGLDAVLVCGLVLLDVFLLKVYGSDPFIKNLRKNTKIHSPN